MGEIVGRQRGDYLEERDQAFHDEQLDRELEFDQALERADRLREKGGLSQVENAEMLRP